VGFVSQNLQLDILTQADGVALQDLAKSVGWTFTSGQVNMFISPVGTVFGHRLEDRLVSSAGIYIYGSALASLGIVIVRPDFQRRGLGKSVVERCLREAEHNGVPVVLVATEQGAPLYTSLGFQAIGSIHRLELRGSVHAVPLSKSLEFHPVKEDNSSDLIAIDELVFGARRVELYRVLFANIECGFVTRNSQSAIEGFALAMRRNDVLVVGPLIASTLDVALALVSKFTANWTGPVRIDVPSEHKTFMTELARLGFKETMVSPLMIRNADGLPGQRNQLFGIVDPVFG
jgi:GNAT superfamily N-acetyltransferase